MSHSMKYTRLAKKLGVKSDKPGSLISRMHSLKGMPKSKKHKNPSTEDGLKMPFRKHKEVDFKKKHKEMPKDLEKTHDGEPEFKKHKVMCKKSHKHTKFCK